MSLPVHVQFALTVYSGTTVDVVLSGVAAGNALIVGIAQSGSAIRSYTVADTGSSRYNEDIHFNPGPAANIFSALNVAGGAMTVTATYGSTSGIIGIAEVQYPNRRAVATGSLLESVSVGTHFCADVGGIAADANVYVFCVGQISSAGTITAGTNFTRLDSGSGPIFQYRTSAAALSGERGSYSSTVNRAGTNSMAAYTSVPVSALGCKRLPIQQRMS